MGASWTQAIVAIIAMLSTSGALIWRAGRHEGKVDAILDRLTEIAGDHEDRIRAQEARRR
jgi:hypothetical protein